MKYSEIIKKMSLEEKAELCVGADYWSSKSFEKYGIPKIRMSDGPHGLRVQRTKADNLGINESEVSTCFPASSTLGNSWNKEMAYQLGKALGEEARQEEVNIVLGPAVNIKRSPLCGRNFEYFSEDPYLTGILGTEYVKGLQDQNVGACVKHFAVNNQENRRRTIDAIIDERTLREIYLKAFETILEEAKPWSIMSAYNKVNGQYCSENTHLLEDILRKEWNYQGIVISDWGGENNRVKGIENDHELEMPGGRGSGKEEIIEAVKTGRVSESKLDHIVDRIISIANRGEHTKESAKYDQEEHHKIAQKMAEESIVLLKNEDNILPIQDEKIALMGDMAKYPRYQGAGSSTINPYKIENAYDSFKENHIMFDYAKGYERIESENDENLRKEAIEVAKKNKIVVIFAGLTENFESEGVDRDNLNIPENQNKLIEEIYKVNKNIIIVLSNGAPIVMPWKDKVKAIITGYLGGEAGAKAMVNCMLGKVNPSGKLAETYPEKLEDTPCYKNYPGTELTVEYQESIYVGYRYYDMNNVKVLFPFGYGLSYTEFEYSNLKVNEQESKVKVSFAIRNIGKRKGKEIAQIYLSQEDPTIFKPKKELKEFEKVELEVGEEKQVEIILNKKAFEYFNPETNKWSIEQGKYKILVGKSSRDIVLEKEIFIESKDKNIEKKYSKKYYTGNVHEIKDEEFEELLGRNIPRRRLMLEEITDENTLEQIKETKIGKLIYENEMEKMNQLLREQNVNKATKVMMDLQKPLKKFYEKKSSKITKEMVEELIRIAKNNEDFLDNAFVKEYLR
ncbi:MAG TPA: glycoside hydrolase family 3 C-terminal domain-containing protein [Candidatus Merdicola faecigallinarum]|uniref:Glycoside hydrolase family 3 C-terminal domain-containing protein n=1 Tax=Candidatus Merdicola faecigallinarum TaxID=2840862 RepID=A0A9D1M2A1_9FIRM|nr:glycoside hydrolase family 3 C-terminal domain-containing protein [Candidatus Merdicola faecigallinarum]